MDEFKVEGMSCGHCVSAVTRAVKELDPMAKVEVDLASGKVKVESRGDHAAVAAALTEAGFPSS